MKPKKPRQKKSDALEQSDVIYRDGKPITARSPAEIAQIHFNHVDPKHPDFNNEGETAVSSFTPMLEFGREAVNERLAKKGGGRARGQQSQSRADQIAQPIYEKFLELEASGIKKHRLISEVATWAQQDKTYNRLTVRQIRRAVDRLRAKNKDKR